jgi:hypothetical protein
MGIRAYVVTQENKYSGGEYFNNRMPEVMDMFDENGIPFAIGWGKKHRRHETHWVIDCEDNELQQYVDKLETLPPDEVHEDFIECENGYSNEWVVGCLKQWLKHIDPKEKVIRIHWH